MGASTTASVIAQLRHERREMRRELARVRWWRQLLKARRDLSVAALTQPDGIGGVDLTSTWEALASDAPTLRELSSAVWPDGAEMTSATVAQLDTLDARLQHYEGRVTENLEAVTAQMVAAMSDAHHSAAVRERDLA